MLRGVRALALFFAIALVALACGNGSRNLLVRAYDAGVDASDEAGADAAADADPTLGGPCIDDAQCDDHIACTFDACDKVALRCRSTPDDAQCDDGIYCDGREVCVRAHGCEAGPVVTCEDGDSCTIDRCVEATKSCAHAPRDLDGDGDPDDHCVPKHDCDDRDPTVASTHSEVCANHKDDNCNGLVDEMPCVTPVGTTCASAIAVGAGTFSISTVGASKTFATSCSVSTPSAGKDVVLAITVPAGQNQDLEVWATATSEVSVAIDGTCGQASTELACGSGATSVRARARNVAPGTYFAVITTQAEGTVEARVAFLSPAPKPVNETCATAAPIALETPVAISIVDPAKDLVSACTSGTGELTYAITLAQTSDVRVYASTVTGSGQPVVGLRSPSCVNASDELRCRVGSTLPLFARALPPATYVLTVAATSTIDASITVHLSAPTTAPADQSCATAPAATTNATMPVDLSSHEDAIRDGCRPGGPTAAYDLSLATPSDVLLVARFPQTESGAVGLDTPACDTASRLACIAGTTPVRASKRNVPAGDYRVVLTDDIGALASLTALVRPTIAPTTVTGADTCATAFDIPASGGFFTGDTTSATANFDSSCDTPTAQPGGAPDQVLRLVLAEPERVVFDMSGSTYTTILEVRSGGACPGQLVSADACYVGFSAERSFLDLELQPGTYFVIVHGYAGAKGPWNLDVRVVAP
jgi:hypothetical protein